VQETFAAFIAGIVLGLMSLKTRSIWMGAVLHVSVALSMDFAALRRKGFFE
jgi:membrane protease YdiL (CAAX protease family)